MKYAFCGRGQVGLSILQWLLSRPELQCQGVVTCPFSPEVGSSPADFEAIAARHGIPYFHTPSMKNLEWEERLCSWELDFVVTIFWTHILPRRIIDTSKLGFLNLHGGLLPRYRGNACQTWAILNGEQEIGITVHWMDGDRLDSGPILRQYKVPISHETMVGDLIKAVWSHGARLVSEAIESILKGNTTGVSQDDRSALYCYPRLPRDGEIDWSQPADQIHRLVRAAGSPYPGAHTYFADIRDHQRIKKLVIHKASPIQPRMAFLAVPGHLIRLEDGQNWAVACGQEQLLQLDEVQIEGWRGPPGKFFKTVRQRLGLSSEDWLRISQQEASSDTGDPEQRVCKVTEGAARQLMHEGHEVTLLPLRNRSFQTCYYQWEEREKRFGLNIYRSLEWGSFSWGYWIITEEGQTWHRVYLACNQEISEADRIRGELSTFFPDLNFVEGQQGNAWKVNLNARSINELQGILLRVGVFIMSHISRPKSNTLALHC